MVCESQSNKISYTDSSELLCLLKAVVAVHSEQVHHKVTLSTSLAGVSSIPLLLSVSV